MTEREFVHRVVEGEADVIQRLLDMFEETKTPYCVIGGLAVNAYTEPVVSLDLDVVVAARSVEVIREKAAKAGWKVESFPHSVNFSSPKSALRIQVQTDARYQEFIGRAVPKPVLGYAMQVACVEDVLRGKVWAYEDAERRKSKRQKDLADILRLIEEHPELQSKLPPSLQELIE